MFGIIDERNCFDLLRQYQKEIELLQAEYFLAPNISFMAKMIEFAKTKKALIVHKHIWRLDCHHSDDPCEQLDLFEEAIAPIPLIRVGNENTTHETCPQEMLDAFKLLLNAQNLFRMEGINDPHPQQLLNVFTQLQSASNRLGGLVGVKVKPVNKAWKTTFVTIDKLEIIGDDDEVATVLEMQNGEKSKFFKLAALEKYIVPETADIE